MRWFLIGLCSYDEYGIHVILSSEFGPTIRFYIGICLSIISSCAKTFFSTRTPQERCILFLRRIFHLFPSVISLWISWLTLSWRKARLQCQLDGMAHPMYKFGFFPCNAWNSTHEYAERDPNYSAWEWFYDLCCPCECLICPITPWTTLTESLNCEQHWATPNNDPYQGKDLKKSSCWVLCPKRDNLQPTLYIIRFSSVEGALTCFQGQPKQHWSWHMVHQTWSTSSEQSTNTIPCQYLLPSHKERKHDLQPILSFRAVTIHSLHPCVNQVSWHGGQYSHCTSSSPNEQVNDVLWHL